MGTRNCEPFFGSAKKRRGNLLNLVKKAKNAIRCAHSGSKDKNQVAICVPVQKMASLRSQF